MQQHYVTFYSPGTFVPEFTEKPIDSWDIETACRMATEIVERYGARPYAFRFKTRSRGESDFEPSLQSFSPTHFINCRVETREEIESRNLPDERILVANLRFGNIARVAVPKSGWKTVVPIRDEDVIVDFDLPDPVTEAHDAT